LDFLKVRLFRVKSVKGLVNYELELPATLRIYLVFYILLLELADPDTPLNTSIKLE
jgi:hypothetical protein